jgi:hypothetical protein
MYALLEQLTLQAAFPLAARRWRSAGPGTTPGGPIPSPLNTTSLVCDIFWKHKRSCGARRIAVELVAMGQPRCFFI